MRLGAPGKLALPEERARLRLALWRPDDARVEAGLPAGFQRPLAGGTARTTERNNHGPRRELPGAGRLC